MVKLPRYTKDFRPVSLLTADTITVGENSIIDANNVHIEIYNEDGSLQMETRMEHAIFDQKNSILHSTEKTVLEGDRLRATGTALTYEEGNQQGFLNGPATTVFIIPHKEQSTAMNLSTPIKSVAQKAVTGAVITATSGLLMAERPPLLNDSELKQLEQQAAPLTGQVTNAQIKSTDELKQAAETSTTTEEKMTPFLKKINQKTLLTTNSNIVNSEQSGFNPTLPEAPAGQETIKITSDGGIYFDMEDSVFVYLKNIRLTSPDFKMSCQDELKFYLNPKTETNSKQDLKQIVATGKVVFIGQDEKGNTYIARASKAHYDAQTETTILRGGYPSIQQSANQYIQSKNEDGYIRIPKKGSIVTSSNSWESKIVIPK